MKQKTCKKQNNTDKKGNPANTYQFKLNNRNTNKWCEICSKLTIEAPEQCH